jgi:hypothetical protein
MQIDIQTHIILLLALNPLFLSMLLETLGMALGFIAMGI